jgi:hypothetical protein
MLTTACSKRTNTPINQTSPTTKQKISVVIFLLLFEDNFSFKKAVNFYGWRYVQSPFYSDNGFYTSFGISLPFSARNGC